MLPNHQKKKLWENLSKYSSKYFTFLKQPCDRVQPTISIEKPVKEQTLNKEAQLENYLQSDDNEGVVDLSLYL
jgi:hypothetical protein